MADETPPTPVPVPARAAWLAGKTLGWITIQLFMIWLVLGALSVLVWLFLASLAVQDELVAGATPEWWGIQVGLGYALVSLTVLFQYIVAGRAAKDAINPSMREINWLYGSFALVLGGMAVLMLGWTDVVNLVNQQRFWLMCFNSVFATFTLLYLFLALAFDIRVSRLVLIGNFFSLGSLIYGWGNLLGWWTAIAAWFTWGLNQVTGWMV